jgi:hypothetical protein
MHATKMPSARFVSGKINPCAIAPVFHRVHLYSASLSLSRKIRCPPAASRRPDYEFRRGRIITAAKSVHAIKTPIAM